MVDTNDGNAEPTDNRTRILAVAEEFFSVKGYDATSVREIVQSASVTSPMLYYYFGSKEELLLTLIRERLAALREALTISLNRATSAQDLIRRWGQTLINATTVAPSSMRFITSTVYGPMSEAARTLTIRGVIDIRDLFVGGIQAFRPDVEADRIAFVHEQLTGMLDRAIFTLSNGYISSVEPEFIDAVTLRAVAVLDDDLPLPSRSLASVEARFRADDSNT